MSKIEETVHIIPLGHEIDRAVKPFETLKADRVYILTNLESDDPNDEMIKNQRIYAEKVKKIISAKKIDVRPLINVNLFSLLDVMKHVSKIIVDETNKKNRVFVNMSAAGRLTSVAATLAGMAHKANVYYVHADGYPTNKTDRRKHGLSICNIDKSESLINFQIVMPEPIGLKILLFLCMEQKRQKTINILRFLKTENVEGFEELFEDVEETRRRRVQSNQLMKLDKTILKKLEDHDYIHRKKDGRHVYFTITESGTYIAHISGLLD
jgi:predicted transcriptional regulator